MNFNYKLEKFNVYPLFGGLLKGEPYVFDFSSKNPKTLNYNLNNFQEFNENIFNELKNSGKKWGIGKGSIDVDWKNNITITFKDQNEVAQIFKLTNKGFWKQQFEFYNLLGEIVIVLTPLNTWKKWTNDLAIESSLNYSNQKYFDELVMYCGFVVRLIQQYAGAGVM